MTTTRHNPEAVLLALATQLKPHIDVMDRLNLVADTISRVMDGIDAVAPAYSHLRARMRIDWGETTDEPMKPVAASRPVIEGRLLDCDIGRSE
jgi:hypothetical protein